MLYSLKNRLIVFFVLLLVLSFGAVSILLFNEARSLIRSYIESSALEKMEEYGAYVDMTMLQTYDVSSLLFNSEVPRKWDAALSDPSLTSGEKMLANIELGQFLTQATNNYTSISSVSIYRQEGLRISSEAEVIEERDFLEEGWYQDFKQRGKHWVSAHADKVELGRYRPYQVVSLLLPIGTFEPTKARNVLKVNVSSDYFLEPLNRLHLGESGTIFLLDEAGQPILAQEGFETHEEAFRQVQDELRVGLSEGVLHTRNDKGAVEIMVYKKLKRNDWLLVGFVSEQDLYASLFNLRRNIILFTSALLILAIIVATRVSYSVTKPLSKLTMAMRYVQKGEFALAESRISVENEARSEVGYVIATFRNMVRQLRQHIKTEFELKLLRQQAEYKALLMQINPHFLFNTLELLSSLAMQRRTDDTVKVIESLGRMMRFSLKINEDLIPLTEEIKYAQHYVSILQIRFKEQLQLAIRIEGSPERREMVKFVLQPLIENAVKYSLQHRSTAHVDISVRCEPDRILLSVSDNGPGMPPVLVEELQDKSAAPQFNEVLQHSSGSIGLRNVLARCQLYYGALFAYTIHSVEEEGTAIELSLPVKEGVPDVSGIDRG